MPCRRPVTSPANRDHVAVPCDWAPATSLPGSSLTTLSLKTKSYCAVMQLPIWHGRGTEHRIIARRDATSISGAGRRRERDERCEIGSRMSGTRPQLEASERLDPAQVAVLQKLAEGGRRDISADGVQPPAADPDAGACRGDAIADVVERRPGSSEEPYGERRVLHAGQRPRQSGGNHGLLRCQPSREEDEPDEPPHVGRVAPGATIR